MTSKIEEISQKITPVKAKRTVEAVRNVKFPRNFQKWMNNYLKIGERDDFVFKWCYKINTEWIMTSVLKRYYSDLAVVKTFFITFVILVDDISEKKNKKKLLKELLKIPFDRKYIELEGLTDIEKKYLLFTIKIWSQIEKRIKKFPRYKEIKGIFEFDVMQLLNAVRYGQFITQNVYCINETEYWVYFPQSMQIIINSDLDLMCTPKFNLKEVGTFREIILQAQKMGRVGNWLTTWEREVKDNDFTSVVIPRALKNGIIIFKDLFAEDKEKNVIRKIKASSIEKELLQEWNNLHNELKTLKVKSSSIDPKRILRKFEFLIFMHLISRGLK